MKLCRHVQLSENFQNLTFSEVGVAKRKWAELRFSAPPPTLAYTNKIWYVFRVWQDAQKSLLDQLPASNRKSAIWTTRCHFKPFQVSIMCVLVLLIGSTITLFLLHLNTCEINYYQEKTFRIPSAVVVAPPRRTQSERHYAIKHKILITRTYVIQMS